MKLVTTASTARNRAGGRMKIRVSPLPARTRPSSSAALSSVRTVVVPTAQTRPPSARARACASAVISGIVNRSSCITCSAGSSTSTGLNVPAPTCSTTSARFTPALGDRGEQLGREVQPRRRRGDRAGLACVHGLVSLDVGRLVSASMYGGSGMWPCASIACSTELDSARSWTMRVRRSVTDTISTVKPGAISTVRPGFSFPPGDTIAS